jgi:hypothetical protein
VAAARRGAAPRAGFAVRFTAGAILRFAIFLGVRVGMVASGA